MSRRIATILPLELDYSARLLEGALQFVREHQEYTLVDYTYSVDAPDRLKLRTPLEFDAAMIWASRSATWVHDLRNQGLPILSVSGDWPVEEIPCLAFDSEAVVQNAVDHLAAFSPAQLLHLEFHLHGLPIKENRARLFKKAARQYGIPTTSEEIFEAGGPPTGEATRRTPLDPSPAARLKTLLSQLKLPAGIWCGEDHLARRVCESVSDLGLRIPKDIAILGLGNFPTSECGTPAISSIPLPGTFIGHQGFSMLSRILAGRLTPRPYTPVPPPPVIVRESSKSLDTRDATGRARALIAERACEGITVGQVADAVGLSPQTLHSRFVHRFKNSPGEEIRKIRIATAKRYLRDSSLTISRVALLCGFDRLNRFSNFFRRETGLSPRAWRNESD